jgi:hypothetical protein
LCFSSGRLSLRSCSAGRSKDRSASTYKSVLRVFADGKDTGWISAKEQDHF